MVFLIDKEFWSKIFFGWTHCLAEISFCSKISFGWESYLVEELSFVEKIFWLKKGIGRRFLFVETILWSKRTFGRKIILVEVNRCSKENFGRNISWSKTYFTQIFCRKKSLVELFLFAIYIWVYISYLALAVNIYIWHNQCAP